MAMTLKAPQLVALAHQRTKGALTQKASVATRFWFYPATSESKGSIVLIHGYRGTHEGLEAIVGALPDFDCYVPDLPAFGDSPPLGVVHSVKNYASWLSQFLNSLNLQGNVTVLAHSFGSIIVAALAAEQKLTQLVLVNPISAPALDGPRRFVSRLSRVYYRVSAAIPERAGRWLLSLPPVIWLVTAFMFVGQDKQLKRWVNEQHQTYFSRFHSAKTAAEGFEASISTNVSQFATAIESSLLLICAQDDDITSIEQQRAAASLYKNATYVELPNVGHLTHYQSPNEIAQHTREFVAAQK